MLFGPPESPRPQTALQKPAFRHGWLIAILITGMPNVNPHLLTPLTTPTYWIDTHLSTGAPIERPLYTVWPRCYALILVSDFVGRTLSVLSRWTLGAALALTIFTVGWLARPQAAPAALPAYTPAFFPPPTLPPAGILLLVDTDADTDAPDGFCSLREAINATNINGIDNECTAAGSPVGATDSIRFAANITSINITSSLPAITDKLSINGGTNKVELHGPGSGTGLAITAPGAPLDGSGSSIRNLVINGFSTGINLDHVGNITIAGNRIGTNSAGTAAVSNSTGISAYYGSMLVGGLSGLTPGGPCTGDCNLISGNTSSGIRSNGFISTTIQGNYIGTDISGTAAIGNGTHGGIWVQQGAATIGGTATGAGNVISGNTDGIQLQTSLADAAGVLIQGNLIGTNAQGTAAVPNSSEGISLSFSNKSYPATIGGTAAGAANVISGNGGSGLLLFTADHVNIHGNFIGTLADGTTSLPNAGAGVLLSSSTHSNLIGGIVAGEGNVIANNGTTGVTIGIYDYYNQIRGNSIHDNTGKGILLSDQQAGYAPAPPLITGVNPAHGTACANCIVDVYSDNSDEGRFFEGTTTADGAGNWTYNAAVTGPNVTATATAPEINNASNLSTSEFSAPMTLPTPTPSLSYSITDPNPHPHTHAHRDSHANAYTNTNANTQPYANTHAHSNPHANADAHTHAQSHAFKHP